MSKEKEIKELFNRYKTIENEISILREDRKILLQEFKEKIDPSTFQAALRMIKIKSRVKPEQKMDFEAVLEVLSEVVSLEDVS
tara:strand:+ start:785 stop:1033 length:249 start_codon:yes stop_codon:yes gene_type:complete